MLTETMCSTQLYEGAFFHTPEELHTYKAISLMYGKTNIVHFGGKVVFCTYGLITRAATADVAIEALTGAATTIGQIARTHNGIRNQLSHWTSTQCAYG